MKVRHSANFGRDIILTGLIGVLLAPAFAEKRIALVVGNFNYKNVPRRPN